MQTTPAILHRRVEPLPWHARPAALAWRRECALAGVFILLLAAALLGPSVAQSAHYHAFADQRSWGGLPHAMDVISNLPFALWGMVGIWALLRAVRERAVSAAAVASAMPARVLTARIAARPSTPANASTMPPRSQARPASPGCRW